MRLTFKILLIFLLASIHRHTEAQDEPGLSGFVQLSGAYMNFRTNTIAGFLGNNISESRTASLDAAPPSQQVITSIGASEIKYTFKRQKWQLYFGGSLLDIVRLELIQQLAVRRFTANKGYISIGLLGTSVPVSVWTDPYAIGVERVATPRNALGLRLDWSRVGKTNLDIRYDYRAINIDERSGEYLGLPEVQGQKLDRNGYAQRLRVNYTKELSKAHTIIPALIFKHINARGEAKKGFGINAQLSYGYKKERFTSATSLILGFRQYSGENPIYQVRQQNQEVSLSQNVFYLLNKKSKYAWLLTGSATYVLSQSNIDFHSQSGFLFQLGIIFRYGPLFTPKTELHNEE